MVPEKKKGSGVLKDKLKLDDKVIKDHISDWTYETKDDQGNKVIKQKGNRSYTPSDVDKNSRLKGFKLCERKDKEGNRTGKYFWESLNNNLTLSS